MKVDVVIAEDDNNEEVGDCDMVIVQVVADACAGAHVRGEASVPANVPSAVG